MPNQQEPCPFAHPIRKGASVEPIDGHFHGVCKDCGAQGPEADSFAAALKGWNSRRSGDGKQ